MSSRAGVIFNVFNVALVWFASFLMIRQNQAGFLVYFFTFSWGFMDGAVNTHT